LITAYADNRWLKRKGYIIYPAKAPRRKEKKEKKLRISRISSLRLNKRLFLATEEKESTENTEIYRAKAPRRKEKKEKGQSLRPGIRAEIDVLWSFCCCLLGECAVSWLQKSPAPIYGSSLIGAG